MSEPKKIHPWRVVKHPEAFKKWQAEGDRKKRFAPPRTPTPWEQGQMVNASDLQKNQLESEMDRQEWRRKNGFKAIQNPLTNLRQLRLINQKEK